MTEQQLNELKAKIESLILQSEKQKAIKFQMQRIAYRNVLQLIAEFESLRGSLFYQKVEKLVDEWKVTNLGEIAPYSPESEINSGLISFMEWLKKNDNDL